MWDPFVNFLPAILYQALQARTQSPLTADSSTRFKMLKILISSYLLDFCIVALTKREVHLKKCPTH